MFFASHATRGSGVPRVCNAQAHALRTLFASCGVFAFSFCAGHSRPP